MKMIVTPRRAQVFLGYIHHQVAQNGIETHCRIQPDGEATAASVLWLFCWAMTGMNSEPARDAAVEAFEKIFGLRFADVKRRIPHEWAQEKRGVPDLPDDEVLRRLQP
ncbi:MAG: hypothetical protein ABI306_07865 [Caulobacteraceae bacterium]